jgi:Arc/MetJ family transcription regulator
VAYLKDEAWFLPRLYKCALEAGVKKEDAEMQHFSRWAFMRARQLGQLGESELAETLFELAKASSIQNRPIFTVTAVLRRLLGWKLTGNLAAKLEGMNGKFKKEAVH